MKNNISFFRKPVRYQFYNATIALIVINFVIFLFRYISPTVLGYLALTPVLVIKKAFYWQVFTYMFVHANFTHIFLNMLALFIFGVPLERRLGSTEFLLFYFTVGLLAGLFTLAVNWYSGMYFIPVVGASGAIYGLLLGYAALFPDSVLFIFGILPLKAPIAVLIFAGLEIFYQLTNLQAGVAHLTHLAGILFAYLYFLIRYRIDAVKVFFKR
ncbi:MAG: rhomboid family intramembrane serine protease [Spirochaetales bacterium]|nr:rhomboid family intramembrane serine protease [Spirochaetales bacterium]